MRLADWYASPGSLPAMPTSDALTDQTRGLPCGDPTVKCETAFKFMDAEMPFAVNDKPARPEPRV